MLYLEFLKDTKPYDFSYMTVIKDQPKRGTGERKPIPENIEGILFELRKATKLNRLRYREYFQDFDPLRKGTVKKNKFRSVVFQTMKYSFLYSGSPSTRGSSQRSRNTTRTTPMKPWSPMPSFATTSKSSLICLYFFPYSGPREGADFKAKGLRLHCHIHKER